LSKADLKSGLFFTFFVGDLTVTSRET